MLYVLNIALIIFSDKPFYKRKVGTKLGLETLKTVYLSFSVVFLLFEMVSSMLSKTLLLSFLRHQTFFVIPSVVA